MNVPDQQNEQDSTEEKKLPQSNQVEEEKESGGDRTEKKEFPQSKRVEEEEESGADRAEKKEFFQSKQVEEEKKSGEDRIVMLSDGIFAIAITLLVLGIQIPQADTHSYKLFIQALQGDFLNNTIFYVITFSVISSYWLEHRRLMNRVRQVSQNFLRLTFLFLAFIAFFPVVSNLVQYTQYSESVVLYSVVLAGCGYSLSLLWIYAFATHRLVGGEENRPEQWFRIVVALMFPTYILLSLFLLLIPNINPSHIFYSWILLPFVRRAIVLVFGIGGRGKHDE